MRRHIDPALLRRYPQEAEISTFLRIQFLPHYGPVTAIDIAEIDSFDHETDVLVLGYGCAGASAALEAVESGADVILLERQSGGFDDSTEDMEKFLLAALGPDADQEKVGLYSRESFAHYQWLVGPACRSNRRCGTPVHGE